MGERVIEARSAEAMDAFGVALAKALPSAQSEPVLLYLTGDLGAGKTTLARGLLRALGVQGTVRSPSFALVETYALTELTALHVDLYRLRDLTELEPLGLRDAHRAHHVWIVEWPERAEGALPEPDLALRLAIEPAMHGIHVEFANARGAEWLRGASAAL